MDFKLFFAVVKRYKRVVIVGAALGVVLSVLSYGTPGLKGGKPTIIPRGSEVWQGEAQVLISQAGFPYGRASTQVVPGTSKNAPAQPLGDLGYMANLSSVYAALANGDYVQHQVAKLTHIRLCPPTLSAIGASAPTSTTGGCGTVVAGSVEQQGNAAPLPLITLTSSASSAGAAAKLTTTTIAVLRGAIAQQQAAAGTTGTQRVVLQTVNSGSPATLEKGHSKSISILVLFAVVSASIALAFILNNHSDDPVRSTLRRLDEGLDHSGGLAVAGGNGHAGPNHGLVQPGGQRRQLIGLRRPASGTRLADEETAPPHLLRRSGSEAESRD